MKLLAKIPNGKSLFKVNCFDLSRIDENKRRAEIMRDMFKA